MQFSVSFDNAISPNLGSLTAAEQQAILDTANAAATIWSWYLSAINVTLELKIFIDNSLFSGNVLAVGGPAVYQTTGATWNGKNVYDPNTKIELTTGQDITPGGDLVIGLTVNSIRNMLQFKTDDYGAVASNRADALSVFLHEIGHGLGILDASESGSFPGVAYYDTLVAGGFFMGGYTQIATNSSFGVPLETNSLSHIRESSAFGGDLMSTAVTNGTNVHISGVDLAMLRDIGVPVRVATSGDDVMHALVGTRLFLDDGNDTGYALAGGSIIEGGNGNDTLYGAAGNDSLDGGNGSDTARYTGGLSNYEVARLGTNSIRVKDLRAGSPDGKDSLTNIETIGWSDGSTSSTGLVPILTTTTVTAHQGQSLALSSLFSASLPDGGAFTRYQLWDSTAASTSGHFVVDGVAQGPGLIIDVSAAQLANATFVTGSTGDNLQIRAFAGIGWSAGDDLAWSPFSVNVVSNRAPVVTTSNVNASPNQVFALSDLFSVTDADGDSITKYQLWDAGRASQSGHFVINGVAQSAGQILDITASQLAQTSFVAGSIGDSLQIRAFDGTAWSAGDTAAWSPFTVSIVSPPPVVTMSDVTKAPNQTVAFSDLISVSSPSGRPITVYQVYEDNAPNIADRSIIESYSPSSGYLMINGVVQAPSQSLTFSADQLSQVSFVTGTAFGDYLRVRVFDGLNWSSPDIQNAPGFKVGISGAANNRPEWTLGTRITGGSFTGTLGVRTAQRNQTLAPSDFSYAWDADGDAITLYEVKDTTTDANSGHFVVVGVTQAAGTVLTLTPAEWAQTVFVTGAIGDTLQMRVSDGKNWSTTPFPPYQWISGDVMPGELAISVANAAPVVQTSNVTLARNQTAALSGLFAVTDADGDAITKYQLLDGTTASDSGHFVINGVAQSAGSVIEISAAQLSQTSFVAGKIGDSLQIRAFDGIAWSAADNAAWSPFSVGISANHAPVVTTVSKNAQRNEVFALSDLFSVSDAEGDTMTKYQLWDAGRDPFSGHFVINGAAQPAGQIIEITASQLSQTSFVAGSIAGDPLEIRAFDGSAWSAADNATWSLFFVGPPGEHAPVLTTSDINAAHNQSFNLSDLFAVTDADNDSMTRYQLWDAGRAAQSGHFVINGVAQVAGQVIEVSAAQLSQTSFVTGSIGDSLQIRAFDGFEWSAGDNAAWAPFNINVPPNHAPVLTTSNISAAHNQSFNLSDLFAVTDADNDSITRYQLWDSTAAPTSGHFVVDGVIQGPGRVIDVSAAQLATTTFVTGGTGDNLQIRAFDGFEWSAGETAAWAPFTVSIPPNRAPVVTTADKTAHAGDVFRLSDLISITDADNDSMTRYQLWDSTAAATSGHFVVGGAAQPAGVIIDVSAAQLASTSFVTGSSGDNLQVRAFDGFAWSAGDTAAWSPFSIAIAP